MEDRDVRPEVIEIREEPEAMEVQDPSREIIEIREDPEAFQLSDSEPEILEIRNAPGDLLCLHLNTYYQPKRFFCFFLFYTISMLLKLYILR